MLYPLWITYGLRTGGIVVWFMVVVFLQFVLFANSLTAIELSLSLSGVTMLG